MILRAVTLACIMHAASLQNLPPMVIFGLLKTEGGRVGHWVTDPNGSHDLGPMQINDRTWLAKIARLQFGGDKRLALAALVYDGCYNVQVGAWIYHQYLAQADGNYGVAVGYYNSHDPNAADRYRRRFLASLDALLDGEPPPAPTRK